MSDEQARGVEFDRERGAAFLQTMTGIMNGGALALMCSVGHKTGLFDAMAGLESATSTEIARAAGLDERYVREWLAAMAAGGVVEHRSLADEGSAETDAYALPAEHAGLLTRAAGPLNLTTYCQYISLLGQVEDEVVQAFRNGGGVPYDRFPTFESLMAESSYQRLSGALLSQVVPLLPDGEARLADGIDVVDVGCGSGRAINLLASAFPNSRFWGYDIAESALSRARAEAVEAGNTNVEFIGRDAAALDEHQRFDLAFSFDAVHDQAHPDRMLAGIFASLRPGGTYLAVEPRASSHVGDNLDSPMAPLMYTVSTMHCMTVSLAAGGMGLGAAWGEQQAVAMLGEAGFADVTVTGIKADRSNHYLLSTRPEEDRA